MNDIANLQTQINALKRQVEKAHLFEVGSFVPLTTPLTSTSWDGDAHSTTAKTLIDLSAVFGVPAGIRGVQVLVMGRDSGSAAAASCFIGLAPNDTADQFAIAGQVRGMINDVYKIDAGTVPCNSDGDIYYQIAATGAGTFDAIIQIWGYVI